MARSFLDAESFCPDHIPADVAAINAELRAATLDAPARWEYDVGVERAAGAHSAGVLPAVPLSTRAETRRISGPGGEIPLRILTPRNGAAEGIYVHFHGGGFTYGSASGQDVMLQELADNARAVCISVEYRLAPEHPFPAGPADCETATWWAVRNGLAEFGVSPVVLGGESAGATLAALVALRLRDRRKYDGLAGLNLAHGAFDLTMTPSMRAATETLILTRPTLERMLKGYLPGIARDDPAVSPLYADLANLPAALFTVGTGDPLLDDTLFMAGRWLAAGNHAELDVVPGAIHAFNFLPIETAARTNRRIEAFILERFRNPVRQARGRA